MKINFENKKIIPLTNEQQHSHEKTKSATFTKKCLYISTLMTEKFVK